MTEMSKVRLQRSASSLRFDLANACHDAATTLPLPHYRFTRTKCKSAYSTLSHYRLVADDVLSRWYLPFHRCSCDSW